MKLNENSRNFWLPGSIWMVFTILKLGDQLLEDEDVKDVEDTKDILDIFGSPQTLKN